MHATNGSRSTAERFKWAVLHGIYGNASEVNSRAAELLTNAERAELFADAEIRVILASLPANADAERIADMANGFQAREYRN